MFKYIHTGDRTKGYIGTVRPDGKIDVTLQPTGRQQTLGFAAELLQYMKDNGGTCDLGDKSDAEEIKRRFQVSKRCSNAPSATSTSNALSQSQTADYV